MTSPGDAPGGEPHERDHGYSAEGIRTLLDTFVLGDPEEHLRLRLILADLQQSAFGVFLFVAILPAFLPVPGLAGGISGPLVTLIGLQMLIGLRKPWLPRFIGERGPRRRTMQRFVGRIAPWLRRLDRLLKPRLSVLVDTLPARAFSGLLLIVLGILLSLPIPFTNYAFGAMLLLFALALLERDGGLMLLSWLGSIAVALSLGLASDQVVDLGREWMQKLR
ncbi:MULTISPECIES: exopolysaccharide biosynthesis protein [unclassified Xanthomonas]|uniref:exopolysaccharide biosynthesis protein n=1 Tax=Xanthomonas sp. LMG 9002 TaxID=1591158 RepID=UPI00136E37E6|nr:exopolysaccharide biosynthesis protein [Xanthomonas sp. LMG 9002]MXV05966.1 exopolysaccharide biosynthesis protein [Xanthomonas sp. LMG 9002]